MSYVKVENKLIANITSVLEYEDCLEKVRRGDREKFIACLIEKISRGEHGYAGFRTKRLLKKILCSHLFGSNLKKEIDQIPSPTYSLDLINNRVEETLKKAYETVPTTGPISMFLFPTFDSFVQEKMFGVNGFTPYQETIHLYLFPKPINEGNFYVK